MAKNIYQSAVINGAPKDVYAMLVDSKKHARFTGAPARIGRAEGSLFSAYGGHLVGRTIEALPAKRLVQAWRAVDWPAGAYSIATFEFAALPRGRTKLTFTQFGVPDANVKSIRNGWRTFYWKPLMAAFAHS